MTTSPEDLVKHIVEHEILGIGTGGSSPTFDVVDGYPTITDTTRSNKKLSISRLSFQGTKKGRAQDVYLSVSDSLPSVLTGYRMTRDGTITAIAIEVSNNASFSLHVRKNGAITNLVTLSIAASSGAHNKSANVDFQEGDSLEFYIEGSCTNPVAWIELAWRF